MTKIKIHNPTKETKKIHGRLLPPGATRYVQDSSGESVSKFTKNQCPHCLQAFKSPAGVKAHIRAKHLEVK